MFQSLKNNKIALSFLGVTLIALVVAFYQYAQVASLRQEAARLRKETKSVRAESMEASKELMSLRLELEKSRKLFEASQAALDKKASRKKR